MKLKLLLFLTVVLLSVSLSATHNRAGEITYKHLGGNEYEVTIITCTKTSVIADREWMPIDWGDGTPVDSIQRDQIVFLSGIDAQRNIYTDTHVFPGPGQYLLYTEDPNRNADVLNIPNSVQTGFSISSLLTILGGANGHNNSPQMLNPPKDNACFNKLYLHNPAAFDPDGDSLAYELAPSTTFNNQVIPGYVFPDQVNPGANNVMSIDPITGTLSWDSPQLIGEYNVVIVIKEYRNGVEIGFVKRDMQINVVGCSNDPPIIQDLPDVCVVANSNLSLAISADDPDGDFVVLEAFGEIFELDNSPATFNQPVSIAALNWSVNCGHVRLSPYTVYIKATDDNPQVMLSDITSFNITVVAPPVENPSATAIANTILLDWDNGPCSNATGYKIYRRITSYGFIPDDCETGVPGYTGYEFLDFVEGWDNSSYLDDNNVPFGNEVCYMVVACFEDGSESIASEEFCAMLDMACPIISHVTVDETSPSNGQVTVRWYPPIEIDTINDFLGPYSYRVLHGDGFNPPLAILESTPQSSILNVGIIEFVHEDINTEDQANTYIIEFYNDGEFICSSNDASSVFLTSQSIDNALELSWIENIPWVNNSYEIYREDDSQIFQLIGTSSEPFYTDTGLVNGQEYCYFVRTFGSYAEPSIQNPLINDSQEWCSRPFDSEPPCAPQLTLDGECEFDNYELSWNNPNNSCADDVVSYNIYYTSVFGGDFELQTSIVGADITSYIPPSESLVGCYVITALDSLLVGPDGFQNQNESVFSDSICVESCPEYTLPNVFSPNGDEYNQFFRPFETDFRYIESIDLTIYNRWGQELFKTTNPEILWEGQVENPLIQINGDGRYYAPDGTYYYVCIVNEKTLMGIVPRVLTGNITMFRDGNKRFE